MSDLSAQLLTIQKSVAGKHDEFSLDVRVSLDMYAEGIDLIRLPTLLLLKQYPVSMEEFLDSKYYLNKASEVYPKIKDSLIELNNPKGDRLGQQYYEAVFTGGIGTGKTTRAIYTTAYQLYILSCYRSPHLLLNQDSASEIFIIFQSLNGRVAKDVDYARFRKIIEVSPYFNIDFPYRKDLESRLVFPMNISCFPVSGETTATIGQNVYGGFMDEVNFMDVISNSKRKMDGGEFNQAMELYNSIASRRESRFMRKGTMSGILCLCSSKNYPDQFTDKKFEESKHDKGIYYRDEVVWDIKPRELFTGGWFHVYIGTATKKPYIVDPDNLEEELAKNGKYIREIPMEYRKRFVNDIYNALREVAGVSTLAKSPYFPDVESLANVFDTNIKSVFTRDDCDFAQTQIGIIKKNIKHINQPRFAHVDLGLTSDAAGITIGFVDRFVDAGIDDMVVQMPHVVIDGTLAVKPPQNGEINFAKIRNIFYKLTSLGMNIKWITFDSYQSVDSIQILRTKGYITGNQSMDKTTLPYDLLKTALLDGRVVIPDNRDLYNEILHLERTEKGKIDHTPYSTKDISDSLAGVVYGLSVQTYIWAMHGVQPHALIQSQLQESEKDE